MMTLRYRFTHWFFRWVMDTDGDLGLQVAGVVTFIKYKEHTCVYWGTHERSGRAHFHPALKWQGRMPPPLTSLQKTQLGISD